MEVLVSEMGVDSEKVSVVKNWTHLRQEAVIADEDQNSFPNGHARKRGITLLHAGNMGLKQGLENVVEAARLADLKSLPVSFVLLGDGVEKDRLQHLARGIDAIKFMDPVGEIEFNEILSSADILLVNEKSGIKEMALPSKLTTYFSAGKPVIAVTALGSNTASEMARSGAGIIVPPGQPAELLKAAIQLGEDPNAMYAMGLRGKFYAKQELGMTSAVEKFDSIINLLQHSQNS
jgi:glycosyltransferase involved in cell wall biosynthesis